MSLRKTASLSLGKQTGQCLRPYQQEFYSKHGRTLPLKRKKANSEEIGTERLQLTAPFSLRWN